MSTSDKAHELLSLAEQWERDAAGCRRDGYIDAAVVKEECAQRIRQTLGISAIAEALAAEGKHAGEVAAWQRSIELRPGHWGEWAEYTDIYGEGRPEKVGRFNCRYRPLYTAPALLSYDDLCRLSSVFNDHSELHLEQDRRINEWISKRIAESLAGEQR